MNNCDFCNIAKYKNLKLCQGVILYEDDLLMVFPARGGLVPGYLMIIIKRHINGFAQLTDNELNHVKKIVANIKKLYKQYFGVDSILLEHGSTSMGRHPLSIVHAHLHLIPFNFNKEIEKELIDSLRLKSINDYNQIKAYAGHDYWYYCNPNGKSFSSVDVLDAPKSIFMNLIAKQVGIPTPYEWRTAGTKKEYIREIINIFKHNQK